MAKLINASYFQGVGVGLLIAWVTGGLAYLRTGDSILLALTALEFVVSAACFIVAYLSMKKESG